MDRMEGKKQMFYTYRLVSVCHPGEHYIGSTSDLKRRLEEHNSGKCAHTTKFMPWVVDFYCAFVTLEKARAFVILRIWLCLKIDQIF